MKTLQILGALLILVTGILGANQYLDLKFALAADVTRLASRLDQKIVSDQLYSTQQRIWTIEDRYINSTMPNTVKEEMRKLIQQKQMLEQELRTVK